ncbi:MAG: carboxypeptidase M32, partial [Romboutsia sp.]|nr:carboxypeptidase M32 [Romboutsia sp.]
ILTMLSSKAFELSVSDEMRDFLDNLTNPEIFNNLDSISKKMISECKKQYDDNKNIPPKLYSKYIQVVSQCEQDWQKAKSDNDFKSMIPYLNEIIELTKEMYSYSKPNVDTYNALLDDYEKGITENQLDVLFKELKEGTIPLIEAISKKDKVNQHIFKGYYPIHLQEKISNYFLNVINFDFNSGCLSQSEHPFTTDINSPYDVRITTNYDINDIRSSLFSVLHEGGHALYEQHISPKLVGTRLNSGTSMGIHESQSRFYENIIGRNLSFWKKHYDKIGEILPSYSNISLDKFYKGINDVTPSLIRIDADELTYNLHVIIRFELEKALFSGDLNVNDLPTTWNDKMKKYLGVVPLDDTTGVLQDCHWYGGLFGYFPSYSLGNIYSGQFLSQIEKELGPIDYLIENDRLCDISNWLKVNIHQYGLMKSPTEIIKDSCNSVIDTKPIIKYYTDKYSKIYNL